MECRKVVSSLSDYLDGSLADGDAGLIEGHLTSCSPCRTVKIELAEIRIAAHELPLHTPPRALWTRLSNTLEAELKSENRAAAAPARQSGWWQDWSTRTFTFTLPQLAGAGALALVVAFVGGSFVGLQRQLNRDLPIAGVQTALLPGEEEKSDLDRRLGAMHARMITWDSQRRDDFERRMAKIEESLQKCRQLLAANPGDRTHQQMYRALYEEKRQMLDDVERLKW